MNINQEVLASGDEELIDYFRENIESTLLRHLDLHNAVLKPNTAEDQYTYSWGSAHGRNDGGSRTSVCGQ